MKKELLKGLSEEQIAKAKACKNVNELLTLAKEEGVELTDEQLDTINGGGVCQSTPDDPCMYCGSKDVDYDRQTTGVLFDYQFEGKCRKCGRSFYIF